jgi:beta-galactosidase
MKRYVGLLLLIIVLTGYSNGEGRIFSPEHIRVRESFDFDWKFLKGDAAEAQRADFVDSAWRTLNLPHDWSIEGPYSETHPTGGSGGYLPTGIGWYRKHFFIPQQYKDRKVFIELDGVYMNSDVWINGHHLGNHPYGYTSFHYDMTPYLNYGDKKNVLAVRVDNSKQPNTRWYSGSGIYRHVRLLVTDKLHISHWGIFVTTAEVSKESADVKVSTKVSNESDVLKKTTLVTSVVDKDGTVIGTVETSHNIAANSEYEFVQHIKVGKPNLWSVDSPYLYKVCSVVKDAGKPVDNVETALGIREILFDVDRGFLLNGEHVKINGVCVHHDGGCVGAAVPERVLERRLEILKEMGCNALRISHNPPAPELLDMCDRMGFLVMDEAFDEWKSGKRKYGYHEYFDQWAIKDLMSMLHRDRNHPSVIIWSVGNEIPEQDDPKGIEILAELVETCHREDPTRPVTVACDHIAAEPRETTAGFLKLLDVVGYNYVDRWRLRTETYYSDDRHNFPNRKFIGSENVSVGGVRADYSLGGRRFWWGDYTTRMIRAEQLWKFVKTHDYVAGDFMWTGIDYLGESWWPHKNSSSGVLDLCGFRKDGFYFYQSQWTDKPMVHIFPHWNWKGKEGQIIPVLCYTNCDGVELFLNDKSYGEKRYEFPRRGMSKKWAHFEKPPIRPTTADLHLSWDVPYEPGTLKAIGKKDGKVVCVQQIQTADEPGKIILTADRKAITADGRDACHITVQIADDKGIFVPTADNLVTFEIEGEGKIIGVGNGNPASHEDFKSNRRKAFNGLCLAIVQSTTKTGQIRVTAASAGLDSDSIIINVVE